MSEDNAPGIGGKPQDNAPMLGGDRREGIRLTGHWYEPNDWSWAEFHLDGKMWDLWHLYAEYEINRINERQNDG